MNKKTLIESSQTDPNIMENDKTPLEVMEDSKRFLDKIYDSKYKYERTEIELQKFKLNSFWDKVLWWTWRIGTGIGVGFLLILIFKYGI